MEELFEKYIQEVPFWNSVNYGHFRRVVPAATYEDFVAFKNWFNSKANRPLINTLIKKHQNIIDTQRKSELAANKRQQANVTHRIPTVKSLTTYIGMFDES
ncbi:MAG: hypothetical protein AAFP76_10075 [Bacteroidota bacterium]